MPLHIHLVAAARPNFMKVAPLYHEIKKEAWCHVTLVHTGQHYDYSMSEAFFADLGLPDPDIHLGVGSGSHAEQTAGVMMAYEQVLLEEPPDWVVVVGDVNSTLACTLTAKKLNIRVAHLEAGLRSFDRNMPEEINRVVTDTLADVLWTPSSDADKNLRREGIPEDRIERVGNIMIDSFEMLRDKITVQRAWETIGLQQSRYGIVTLHRPANVDHKENLSAIIAALTRISERLPLVFPIHPRTKARLEAFQLFDNLRSGRIILVNPLSYCPFMSLITQASVVITDSGGLQEETTYLGIPCLTLRQNTERPITVLIGTNRLVGTDDLETCLNEIVEGRWPKGQRPELWDGHTARRVAQDIKRRLLS